MERTTHLFAALWCLSFLPAALADHTVTRTVILVSQSTGLTPLTGAALSSILATPTASPDDGSDVPAGGVGSSATSEDTGSSGGKYGISTGATIGISVAAGLVIIGIVVLWVLWFLAKKRGWEVRKSIRRASRRVTGRFEAARSRRNSTTRGVRMASRSPPQSRDRDLEKGRNGGSKITTTAVSAGRTDQKANRAVVAIAPPSDLSRLAGPPAARTRPYDDDRTQARGVPASDFPGRQSFRDKFMSRGG